MHNYLNHTINNFFSIPLINKEEEIQLICGLQLSKEEIVRNNKAREERFNKTEEIANKLEAQGIDARYAGDYYLVSSYDFHAEKITLFRNNSFLPESAHRHYRLYRDRLNAYLQYTKPKGLHSQVISFGAVRVQDYSNMHEEFTKLLGLFTRYVRSKGANPIHYSIERPIFYRGEEAYVNLHAHYLYACDDKGTIELLAQYINDSACQWGSSEKEVFPKDYEKTSAYLFKDDNTHQLRSPDLAELYTQQLHKHCQQPLGTFRKFVSKLNNSNLRLIKLPNGKFVMAPRSYRKRYTPLYALDQPCPPNRLLRITRPIYLGSSGIKAPAFLVKDYNHNKDDLRKLPAVSKIAEKVQSAIPDTSFNDYIRVSRNKDLNSHPIHLIPKEVPKQYSIPFKRKEHYMNRIQNLFLLKCHQNMDYSFVSYN